MFTRRWVRLLVSTIAMLALALVVVSQALAAEIAGGDIYRLAAGQVVEDDLVVSAAEVYIDGTVKGDLVAAGRLVQVNGTVEGDLIAAGAEVEMNGTVGDDARLAGASVLIKGSIADDLFAAAGGGQGAANFSQVGGMPAQQGLRLAEGARVGGSAYLAAGEALMAGSVKEGLYAGAGLFTLAGSVGGDAQIDGGTVTVDPGASVEGTLTYRTQKEGVVPQGVAGDVRFEPTPPPQQDTGPGLLGRMVRTLLIIAGFALLGWLLLRFTPEAVRRPAAAVAARPAQAGLYGLLAAALLLFVPLLTLLLIAAMALFWGWWPALLLAAFLFAGVLLVWVLSPLVTGLWLGRWLLQATGRSGGDLLALLVGAALIVLLSMVPLVGWLISLLSFLLALGGLLLARRQAYDAPVATSPAASGA
ncbi:MAG: polymer-forming cytoskeletal protein [Chloroflexales bacterium]|nr:polymer-forming cytoskeletal protein [Chloroflexales bacterium]